MQEQRLTVSAAEAGSDGELEEVNADDDPNVNRTRVAMIEAFMVAVLSISVGASRLWMLF